MEKESILIGSCGGLTGVYLAKQFSKMGKYIVCGADSAAVSAGAFFVDEFYHLPRANDADFMDALVELINARNITYYLPTHSSEVRRVAVQEKELRQRTCVKFLVSPIDTFQLLESKEQAYHALTETGIPAPRMYTEEPDVFPVIMKGNIGSGGASVLRIDNVKVYRAYKETASNANFYEFVEGQEYTADCMFDAEGVLLACNVRERVKTIGGAAVICQNVYDREILYWIRKMAQTWKFCGCVNFQCIVKDGIPRFTDINLRYPSGGLPLTVQSGINVPEMMIRLLNGEKLAWGDYQVDPSVNRMYRYFDEVYD